MTRSRALLLALSWGLSGMIMAPVHAVELGKSVSPTSGSASPEKSTTGVSFIDGSTADEKIRPYLLPIPLINITNESDVELVDYIHEKMKWEKQ
ncbi:TPA: hypothetical protein ACGTRQ_003798 [Vibrio parahaemolyticus]